MGERGCRAGAGFGLLLLGGWFFLLSFNSIVRFFFVSLFCITFV